MALVLETLRSNQTLDLRGLGVRFLALALGLDFAADDELANLIHRYISDFVLALRLNHSQE